MMEDSTQFLTLLFLVAGIVALGIQLVSVGKSIENLITTYWALKERVNRLEEQHRREAIRRNSRND